MSLKTIKNQPLAVQLAQRWLAKKTNQPLVLYGPEGAGKRELALAIAKALNCSETPGVEGCGQCLNCKKIEAGRHADVRIVDLNLQAVLRGEPVEKQQSLRIETILDERRRLYQTAVEGAWKVSVIHDAHRFTMDAGNVLLKILEEPPARTAIFLLTPYRDRLLATLLSRCQPVRFRPPTEGTAVDAEAEALWKKIPSLTPDQVLGRQDRSRSAPARGEMDAQLKALLGPAMRDLRSNPGQKRAIQKVEFIQQAQIQLKQNVPPGLIYEHLLLRLARASR